MLKTIPWAADRGCYGIKASGSIQTSRKAEQVDRRVVLAESMFRFF